MLSFELQAHLNKHSTRMSDLGFVSGLEDLKKKVAISFTSTALRILCRFISYSQAQFLG